MQQQRKLSVALFLALGTSAAAQTSFDLDRIIAPGFGPNGILTEGFPGLPIVAITEAAMGLGFFGPGDEIDALSYGDDFTIQTIHTIVFSPNFSTVGVSGTAVAFEVAIDTAPGTPPAAAGDIFVQSTTSAVGNELAPPTLGYAGGTTTGDEANAAWGGPCVPGAAVCHDLDAFDYGDPMLATGVYFSLAPGSPTLMALGATHGAILYSDLSGAPPIIAILAGAGPATAGNLGVGGLNLDALNVVGTTGPVGAGGGVILPGVVAPSVSGFIGPPSTHLAQFSVSFSGTLDADILVRVAAGALAVHTPAGDLGLMLTEDLNALEVTQPNPNCPPTPATVFQYNGMGINLDTMTASGALIGGTWSVTLAPQAARGAGGWIILMRGSPGAGPVLDLGLLLALPPAGLSELLVAGAFIANFFGPLHGGGGSVSNFTTAVPSNCSIIGMSWYAQAAVFGNLPAGGGALDPWFSSASGGVIGTF